MPFLYPSLMAADPLNLNAVISALNPYCSGYHLDIMDGHYVPNLAFNPSTITAISKITQHPLWVHWMVEDPLKISSYFTFPRQSLLSFHIEKNKDIKKCIKMSKENDFKVGIALGPKTPVEESFIVLHDMIDDVLIMAVEPGFSGQKFMPETYTRIKSLVDYRKKNRFTFTISVDGGIDYTNLPLLINEQVNLIALGSAIFSSQNPADALCKLHASIGSSR